MPASETSIKKDKILPIDQDMLAINEAITLAQPISGRVLLASGEEFFCTAKLFLRLQGIVLVKATASVGEVVICALDNIGILVGKVVELLPVGFRVAFMIRENQRGKVVTRLEWHTAQARQSAELRQAPRLVPLHRSVEVRLAQTVVLAGTILDISMSGAAISLQPNPGLFIGGVVRVGSRLATVARLIESGVAVQFAEPFTAHNFDERVRP